MTPGFRWTYWSIMPWVSWRLPATSRMFSATGAEGLSGTVPPVGPDSPAGWPGAPQAATRVRDTNSAAAPRRRRGNNMAGSLRLGMRCRAGGVADHEVRLELPARKRALGVREQL